MTNPGVTFPSPPAAPPSAAPTVRREPLAQLALVVTVATAAVHAVLVVLNLMERQLQQDRARGVLHASRIRSTVDAIHFWNRLALIGAIATVVTVVVWQARRRVFGQRAERSAAGVKARALTTFGGLFVAVAASEIARSDVSSTPTVSDIVSYRTWQVVASSARVVLFASIAASVLVTVRADRRPPA